MPNNEEFEVKFLDINPTEIEQKLKKLGAKKQFERVFRRRVFDFPDYRLNAKHSWLRLRDEGEQVTLTYKKRRDAQGIDGKTNDSGMEEVEIVVSDFDKTAELLRKIGMIEKFYEENKRTQYKLDGVEYDIDHWPLLNPHLEIEADSWDKVEEAILKLGLDPVDKKIFSTYQMYQLNGINEDDYQILTFDKQLKKVLNPQ